MGNKMETSLELFEKFIKSLSNSDRIKIRENTYNRQKQFYWKMINGREFQIAFDMDEGYCQWYDVEVDYY